MGEKGGKPALTREQRRLVSENVGLVAVHLRRFVPNLQQPRRDREWDDLFQEGCLGLMRAAIDFDPDRGIPFASFALPRIHNAVSRALHRRFSTVYIPPAGAGTTREASGAGRSSGVPGAHSLSDREAADLAERKCHQHDNNEHETIGQRLRGKYERAVRAAARRLAGKTSTRGDRDALVRKLVEQRFLIPHEESKTALRQIARETRSSYARVAQCDKRLHDVIREALGADPEFEALRKLSRSHPDGLHRPIEPDLERELARISADAFVRCMRKAAPAQRAGLLDTLMTISQVGFDDTVRARVAGMGVSLRERLFRKVRDQTRQGRVS